MADTYVVKVESGHAKLYNSNGGYVRSIGNDVISAVVSGDEVHTTVKGGKVKIYGVNGGYKRTI